MRPFRNKGWPWLRYMEQILPIAGVAGAYSFAPSQSNPAPVGGQEDEGLDAMSSLLTADGMEVDSTQLPPSGSTHTSASVPTSLLVPASTFTQQSTTKQQRTSSDASNPIPHQRSPGYTPPPSTSSHSISSDKCNMKKPLGKANRHATSLSHSSAHSASSVPTSQRVAKMTPAVAFVTLKTSVDSMTVK